MTRDEDRASSGNPPIEGTDLAKAGQSVPKKKKPDAQSLRHMWPQNPVTAEIDLPEPTRGFILDPF